MAAERTTGTGTDIVSVARVGALFSTYGDRFLRRWFTPDEVGYCTAMAVPERHLAARLAAKEAVVKALRAPADGPLPWRGIEVGHDEVGAPVVRLSGRARELADRGGVGRLHVSLSHCDEYAVASAVAVAVAVGDPSPASSGQVDAPPAGRHAPNGG